MRKSDYLRIVIVLIFAVVLGSAALNATPVIVTTGPGSASVIYEGGVKYMPTFPGPLLGTIIDKQQGGSVLILDVSYAAADLDWATGFRWAEQITNNSGSIWSSYTLQLTTSGTYFSDAYSPTFVTVTSLGTPAILTKDLLFGTLLLSPDRKTITLNFSTPLLPGSSFAVHTPIEGLTATGGSFQITETAVPEPTSLLLLGTGLSILGVLASRLKK